MPEMETAKQAKRHVRGIFERPKGSGIWWIRYCDAAGKLHREKAGTKGMAITLYRKRKMEALEGRKLPERLRRRPVLFEELIEDALAYSKTHKRSYRDDLCRLGKVREWFGSCPAEAISPADIEGQLATLKAGGLAPATLNRYRSLLSLCFRLGMAAGKVSGNPARLVKRHLEDNTRVRFLSQAEEARLRAVIRERWPEHEPELDIALHTGIRRGGMYKLEWPDVDFEHRVLRERASKSGKTRYIPLNQPALEAFLALRRASRGEGRIFNIQKPRHWFEKAVAMAGISDFTWHDLRHTFGSRLAMAGVSLEVIRKLMGHGSITVTTRYAHLAPAFEQAAVDRLASFGQREGQERPDFQERSDTKSDTSHFAIQ